MRSPLPIVSQLLIPHPTCVVPDAWRVGVAWAWRLERDRFNIRFELPRHGVRFPPLSGSSPRRVDRLWRHTCVELFVAVPASAAYREFNFASNGNWAAYDFVAYRRQAAALPDILPPQLATLVAGDACFVTVELAAACLPDATQASFSATVVLESSSGALSYWAAHHPGTEPDFHHRDGFVLTLD